MIRIEKSIMTRLPVIIHPWIKVGERIDQLLALPGSYRAHQTLMIAVQVLRGIAVNPTLILEELSLLSEEEGVYPLPGKLRIIY